MSFKNSSSGYFLGGLIFIGLALFSIATGEMSLRSGDAIRRATSPGEFWFFVLCFAGAGAGFIAWGLGLRKREQEE